jgi:hypothetical protein
MKTCEYRVDFDFSTEAPGNGPPPEPMPEIETHK